MTERWMEKLRTIWRLRLVLAVLRAAQDEARDIRDVMEGRLGMDPEETEVLRVMGSDLQYYVDSLEYMVEWMERGMKWETERTEKAKGEADHE